MRIFKYYLCTTYHRIRMSISINCIISTRYCRVFNYDRGILNIFVIQYTCSICSRCFINDTIQFQFSIICRKRYSHFIICDISISQFKTTSFHQDECSAFNLIINGQCFLIKINIHYLRFKYNKGRNSTIFAQYKTELSIICQINQCSFF